jgi:hypothetical protein
MTYSVTNAGTSDWTTESTDCISPIPSVIVNSLARTRSATDSMSRASSPSSAASSSRQKIDDPPADRVAEAHTGSPVPGRSSSPSTGSRKGKERDLGEDESEDGHQLSDELPEAGDVAERAVTQTGQHPSGNAVTNGDSEEDEEVDEGSEEDSEGEEEEP